MQLPRNVCTLMTSVELKTRMRIMELFLEYRTVASTISHWGGIFLSKTGLKIKGEGLSGGSRARLVFLRDDQGSEIQI